MTSIEDTYQTLAAIPFKIRAYHSLKIVAFTDTREKFAEFLLLYNLGFLDVYYVAVKAGE